jgi:hypothetical protein
MRKLIVVSFMCLLVGCRSVSQRNEVVFGQRPETAFEAQAPAPRPLFTPPFRHEWTVEEEEMLRDTMATVARIGVVVALEVLRQQAQR